MRSPYWPLFGLRIVTPRLELRPPSDEDLADLAAVAADGVHDPDFMPFSVPWTEGGPETAARNVLQFNWRLRGDWKPEAWHLSLVTVVDGEVVGTQGILANDFGITKTVETGSWLGKRHQGKGIGKEMRAAVLHFAFGGLGAEVALERRMAGQPALPRRQRGAGLRAERGARRGASGPRRSIGRVAPPALGLGGEPARRHTHRRARRLPRRIWCVTVAGRRSAPPGERSTDCRASRAGAGGSEADDGDEDQSAARSFAATSSASPG